jgi:hypothetical protein
MIKLSYSTFGLTNLSFLDAIDVVDSAGCLSCHRITFLHAFKTARAIHDESGSGRQEAPHQSSQERN